jgi:hypothetical protein
MRLTILLCCPLTHCIATVIRPTTGPRFSFVRLFRTDGIDNTFRDPGIALLCLHLHRVADTPEPAQLHSCDP